MFLDENKKNEKEKNHQKQRLGYTYLLLSAYEMMKCD